MARWRLTAPHYLNGTGTTWEYRETDRATGKQVRRAFDVPRLVDPQDPGDWTVTRIPKEDGDVIVCDGVNPGPNDLIWKGDPTPDMVPMDEDAEAKSAKFAGRWNHPIDSLPGTYSQSLLDGLQGEFAKAMAGNKSAAPEGMTELLQAMTAMMQQNAQLLAALAPQRRA